MRQFIDVTGKTEDEAISRALEQLGLDRDDVSVEILEACQGRIFGSRQLSRQGPCQLRTRGGACLSAARAEKVGRAGGKAQSAPA